MSGLKKGIGLLVLCGCVSQTGLALAAPQPAEAAPASAVAAPHDPEQNYQSGIQAEADADMVGAMDFYRLAADAGHAKAQARLGELMRQGQFHVEAEKYFRMAAAQGNRDGQYGLGFIYREGEGVKRDYDEARKWLVLSGEQGHEEAIRVMSIAYIKGAVGIDQAAQQSQEALAWIRRGAGMDFLPALDALAAAYRTGQFGLEPDPDQADVIVQKTNKMRNIKPKEEKKKSLLLRMLKDDETGKEAEPEKKPAKRAW